MDFKLWLKLDELATGTNAVATFSRPIGEPVRRKMVKPIVMKKEEAYPGAPTAPTLGGPQKTVSVSPINAKLSPNSRQAYDFVYNKIKGNLNDPSSQKLAKMLANAKDGMEKDLMDYYKKEMNPPVYTQ